jgi:hypothetical protein
MSTKLVKRFQNPAGPLAPKPYSVTYDWKKADTGSKFVGDIVRRVESTTKPI